MLCLSRFPGRSRNEPYTTRLFSPDGTPNSLSPNKSRFYGSSQQSWESDEQYCAILAILQAVRPRCAADAAPGPRLRVPHAHGHRPAAATDCSRWPRVPSDPPPGGARGEFGRPKILIPTPSPSGPRSTSTSGSVCRVRNRRPFRDPAVDRVRVGVVSHERVAFGQLRLLPRQNFAAQHTRTGWITPIDLRKTRPPPALVDPV